jgi:hypothetical protein
MLQPPSGTATWIAVHVQKHYLLCNQAPIHLTHVCICVFLQVVGVIRNKYLFKTRPRPLITKPHSSR